jgi:regulator of sigma E protease
MWQYPKIPNPVSPRIGYLAADGAAKQAGLQVGDRIVSIDGQQSPDWESIKIKEVTSAGQPLDLYVMRGEQRINITVTPKFVASEGAGSAGWAAESEVQIGGFCCGVEVAKDAGLKAGDAIVSLNGTPVLSANHFIDLIGASKGEATQVVYRRNGREITTELKPVWSDYEGTSQWRVGAQLQTPYEIAQLPIGEAFSQSVHENVKSAGMIYTFLKGVVQRRMSPKAISGPIGIARMSGEAARMGAAPYIGLMAAVSLNLAVVNLLPIPLLDGGTILMLFVEMLMRRDLDLRVKEAVVKFGLVFLMVVIVFVIYNDISKMIPGG